VRLDVSDRLVDVQHGEADLAVRCGAGRWRGLQAVRLMAEEVFPVCSPALFAQPPAALPRSAKQLAKLPLIHDSTAAAAQAFPTWSQWLQAQGVAHTAQASGLQINASAAAIQAALNGQGVALARRVFVQDDIHHGRLLRLLPQVSWPVAWAYYAVHTETSVQRNATRVFLDWLLAQAQGSVEPLAQP
jgi:LysR family transcriptional regulator, glycine cleavage system transcriptional activator